MFKPMGDKNTAVVYSKRAHEARGWARGQVILYNAVAVLLDFKPPFTQQFRSHGRHHSFQYSPAARRHSAHIVC